MTVNISGQVPAEAQNGMVAIEEDWLGDRTPDPVVAIVIIERDGFRFKDDKQERTATMKFRHIEPLLSEADAQTARDLLERACRNRGGEVFRPAPEDTPLDLPDPDVDLETPLAEGQVTEGPWETSVEFSDGGDAA